MRLLSLTTHAYLPQKFGGSECGTHALMQRMQKQGWQVGVAASLLPAGWAGWQHRFMRRLGVTTHADRVCGYPVFRRWHVLDELSSILAAFCPDAIVIQAGAPGACLRALQHYAGPVVVYLRDTLFESWDGDVSPAPGRYFLANSEYVQRTVAAKFGIRSELVYSLIEAEPFRLTADGDEVLCINPHPLKGGDVMLAVAEQCPDIRFRIVECWSLPLPVRERLRAWAARLPNVIWQAATQDMPALYRRARVVFAPSQCDDAFPRVVREAQYAGVPALASRRGGVPEVVGDAGLILDSAAPVTEWVAALRHIRTADVHARLSQRARELAERPELQPDAIARCFFDCMTAFAQQHQRYQQ